MERSDPPPRQRSSPGGAVKFRAEAEELRDNPGDWYLFETAKNADKLGVRAAYINTGRLASFRPGGDFEATVSKREDKDGGGFGLWVRYTGEAEWAWRDKQQQRGT